LLTTFPITKLPRQLTNNALSGLIATKPAS
jgi:hypothetical protein